MRITVSHHRPVEEIRRNIDRSFDDLFRGIAIVPIQIVNEHRSWEGNLLTFGFTGKMGFIRTPIKGTVEVTASEVIVDVDLGLLEKLLPAEQTRAAVQDHVKGLLT